MDVRRDSEHIDLTLNWEMTLLWVGNVLQHDATHTCRGNKRLEKTTVQQGARDNLNVPPQNLAKDKLSVA